MANQLKRNVDDPTNTLSPDSVDTPKNVAPDFKALAQTAVAQSATSEAEKRVAWLISARLFSQAIVEANEAISRNPQSVRLIKLMGTAFLGLDQFSEAREVFELALLLDPRDSTVLTDLGACCIKLNDGAGAVRYFGELVVQSPEDAEAHYKLGLALEVQQNLEAAVGCFANAVTYNPKHIGALVRMSVLCRQLGYNDHAIQAQSKAVDLNPDDADLWMRLGELYLVTGATREAVNVLKRTVETDPTLDRAYCALGFAHLGEEQYEKAVDVFQGYFKDHPEDFESIKGLATASRKVGDFKLAREIFQKWLDLDCESFEANFNFGEFHYEIEKLDEARRYTCAALEKEPTSLQAQMQLALIEKSAGNFDIFQRYLRDIIETDPFHASAMRFLIDFANDEELNTIYDRLKSLSEDDSAALNRRKDAFYGISKISEKRGAFKDVVAFLDRLSDVVRDEGEGATIEKRRKEAAEIKRVFAHPKPPLAPQAASGPVPIFILGMPRSGTTMTEQILSNHSEVHGGGELPFLKLAVRRSDSLMSEASADSLMALREAYFNQVSEIDVGSCRYITDKMPMNFTYIGFIATAIPEAKIVHLSRSAEAVCWSNLKAPFGAKGLEYSYHQEEVARQFRDYADLMDFWKTLYKEKVIDLCYERVTEDPAPTVKSLFDNLDIPWEENVLNISQNKRSIRTASYKQVRQDIYKGSSEEWKQYSDYLQPMLNVLRA